MIKKKNVLIIGGLGQVGKELTKFLLKKDNKVHVITNKKSKKKIKNSIISIFDISNKKKVFKFLKKNKINYIYFLASHNISSTEKETESLNDKNIKTNVISLTNFLNYIYKYDRKIKLFYSSSSHIFNNQFRYPQKESTKAKFSSFYGLAKFLGKEICEFYRNEKRIFCSVGIMYTNVSINIGKNFLIKTIISQLKSKKKFVKLNNPNAKIDIISTKDAVKAMYKIMQLEKSNTFIISRSKFISIKQIYNQISKKMGINKKIIINSKKNKNKNNYLIGDNKKIQKMTKWKPEDNLNDIVDLFFKNEK